MFVPSKSFYIRSNYCCFKIRIYDVCFGRLCASLFMLNLHIWHSIFWRKITHVELQNMRQTQYILWVFFFVCASHKMLLGITFAKNVWEFLGNCWQVQNETVIIVQIKQQNMLSISRRQRLTANFAPDAVCSFSFLFWMRFAQNAFGDYLRKKCVRTSWELLTVLKGNCDNCPD